MAGKFEHQKKYDVNVCKQETSLYRYLLVIFIATIKIKVRHSMRTNRLHEITFEKDARSVHLPYMCLQTAKYHAVIYGSCINNSKAYIHVANQKTLRQ